MCYCMETLAGGGTKDEKKDTGSRNDIIDVVPDT